MAFDREQIKKRTAALAANGVFVGTSSWKYEGWLGQLYTPARYEYRGKVATKRFERDCLTEYAEVFKTVCVDAAYYTFPRVEYLQGLAAQVPDDFRFGFKVTDVITIKKYPNHPRHGPKAGQPNADFLNADLFATAFLKPCGEIRTMVGLLMFEFSRFWPNDYEHGRDFLADLDSFLGELLPALLKAKAHTRSSACINHLHQMGLALRMYVDDNNHTYPRLLSIDPGKAPVYWFNRLAPFYKLAWTNTAYHCPGYRGANGDEGSGSDLQGLGSYAYNAIGLRLTDSNGGNQPDPLGLGPMRGARLISDAQVVAPAEMFAIGESRFLSKEANERAGGGCYMVRGLLIDTPPWLRFDPARHGKTYNQLFADGHVGAMNPWVLYNCTNSGVMWNNDHKPHPELWVP